MASRIDDRWLWLGLGVFTFIAIKSVSHGLHHIVALTEVHSALSVPRIPLPRLGKEDAIKTESLQVLATCENVEIRKAATKMLCERFKAHAPACKKLIKDLKSKDPEAQRRAKLALSLLISNGSMDDVLREGGSRRTAYAAMSGISGWPTINGGITARNHDESIEERDLRRRRREAMVINEGDRPVSQEDVWMRDGEGRMGTEEARDLQVLAEGLERLGDVLDEFSAALN